MAQTALEWFVHQIGPFLEMDKVDAIKVIEQAKAMEKHQTLVFGMKCQADYIKYDFNRNIVDIYNETYNK